MSFLLCPYLTQRFGYPQSQKTTFALLHMGCGAIEGAEHRAMAQNGRSSAGCKAALSLPGRTMPAPFTPAEDLIGIWLCLQKLGLLHHCASDLLSQESTKNLITGSYWDLQPCLRMLIIKVVTEGTENWLGNLDRFWRGKWEPSICGLGDEITAEI